MKTLIKVAIRIVIAFMIYEVLLRLIGSLLTINAYNYYGSGLDIFTYAASVFSVYLVITVILVLVWIKADRLVHFIAGPIRGNEITINTSNADLLAAALSIFGVYLIVNALTGLAGLYAYHWQVAVLTPQGVVVPGWTASESSNAIVHALSLLIGAAFVLGNKGLRKLWKSVKNIGRSPEGSEATEDQPSP